jgi:hypothetical protein
MSDMRRTLACELSSSRDSRDELESMLCSLLCPFTATERSCETAKRASPCTHLCAGDEGVNLHACSVLLFATLGTMQGL